MLQGVDHVLNPLVVAGVVCVTGVDDSADSRVDDLFKVQLAGERLFCMRHCCVSQGREVTEHQVRIPGVFKLPN